MEKKIHSHDYNKCYILNIGMINIHKLVMNVSIECLHCTGVRAARYRKYDGVAIVKRPVDVCTHDPF